MNFAGTSEKGDLVPPTKRRKMQQVNGNNRIDNGGESVLTRETAERLGPPKRWLYCPPMGKEICGFLPIKTPLSQLYDGCIPDPQYRFYPSDVFTYAPKYCETPNLKIGLWIDLTKTSRYYQKSELRGAKFVKMPLAGHDEAPSRSDVDHFIQCVQAFRKDHPDDLIVVHCTHGFNRTGFLICSYIYKELGDSMEFSVEMFARARPHGIYKEDYLKELKTMFSPDEELICPERPVWEDDANPPFNFGSWKGIGAGQNGHCMQPTSSSADTSSVQAPQMDDGKPRFMDGQVQNATLVEDEEMQEYLRNTIKEYCSFKSNVFPGSQPVSLERTQERDNMRFLVEQEYMVSWKADGVRYLVLIKDEDQIYAFDRDNNVFELGGISFPHRKLNRHITNTLVDAEMIIEHIPEMNGKQAQVRPRLLIYDIVKFEDTQAGECNFRVRFACIRDELIQPRCKAAAEGKINPAEEPMGIRRKDFYELSATPKLLSDEFTSTIPHETDGLIFQPVAGPYTPGRYDKLLKWKPQDQSTIDFRLSIVKETGCGMIPQTVGYLYVIGLDRPFAKMKVKRSDLPFDNKIVECKFDSEIKDWKIIRERTDKSFPNAYETAKSVVRCIRSPITKEVLLQFIQELVQKRKSE